MKGNYHGREPMQRTLDGRSSQTMPTDSTAIKSTPCLNENDSKKSFHPVEQRVHTNFERVKKAHERGLSCFGGLRFVHANILHRAVDGLVA